MAKHDKTRSWDEKLSRPTNDYDDSTRFSKGAREWEGVEDREEEDSFSLRDRDYQAAARDSGYRRDPGNFSRENNNGEQNGWYRDTPPPRETSRREEGDARQGRNWEDDDNESYARTSGRGQEGDYMGQSDDYRYGNDDYLASERSQRDENAPRQRGPIDNDRERGFQDRYQGRGRY